LLNNEEFDSIREFITIDEKKIQETLLDESYFSYKVYFRLNPTCILKSVRLFIIFRSLNELGTICFTNPAPQMLESGNFKREFEVYFISQKNDKEILNALDEILEIENKYILIKSKDEFISIFRDFTSKGIVDDKVGRDTETPDKSSKEHQARVIEQKVEESKKSQIKTETSKNQFSNVTDLQKDALKEIGNIGAGNAANALAGLINKRVDINIPSVQIIELDKYLEGITKHDYKLFTMWSNITGDNKATILVIFKITDVLKLVSIMIEGLEESKTILSENDINSIDDLPELYASALNELGNILANHYSSALGSLLELNIRADPPGMSVDIGKQLHDTISEKAGLFKGVSLLIGTTIMVKDLIASGSCVFIPDPTTMDKLLDSLSQFI